MNKKSEELKSKIKDITRKETKIQNILDDTPKVDDKEGLLDTIDWLEKILISFRDFKKI